MRPTPVHVCEMVSVKERAVQHIPAVIHIIYSLYIVRILSVISQSSAVEAAGATPVCFTEIKNSLNVSQKKEKHNKTQ